MKDYIKFVSIRPRTKGSTASGPLKIVWAARWLLQSIREVKGDIAQSGNHILQYEDYWCVTVNGVDYPITIETVREIEAFMDQAV